MTGKAMSWLLMKGKMFPFMSLNYDLRGIRQKLCVLNNTFYFCTLVEMPMVSTSVVIEQSAYVTEMASLLKKKEEKEPTNCKSFELNHPKACQPSFHGGT
jgi:hypothetical protein